MGYKFNYSKVFKTFRCSSCLLLRHYIIAKICKNENREEYISLRNKKHICQPIKSKRVKPKIIKLPFYQLINQRYGGKLI